MAHTPGVWIGENEPTQPWSSYPGAWIKPSTGEIRIRDDQGQWEVIGITFNKIEAVILEVTGGAEISGGLECGGEVGITTQVTISGTTLKFSDGILYEVEVP